MADPFVITRPDPWDMIPKESERFGNEPRTDDQWYMGPRDVEVERDSSGGLKDSPGVARPAPGNEVPWSDLTRGRE